MKHDDARKILRSRGGLKITIDDTADRERFVIETSGGQKFLLQNGPGQIEVSDGNGNTARFDAGGITVNAAAKVTINASEVEINSGTITLNSGMSKFAGVVQCDTLISNSVVASSYTPGAGNIW